MDELRALNLKFEQLVETRRELFQQNKDLQARNKATIEKVKQRNTKLKQDIITKQDLLENPQVVDMAQLDRELQQWRRKLDDQKLNVEKGKQRLRVLQERQEQSKSVKGGLDDKQMRVLENRLDKVMIKTSEAANIKQTYLAILKRFEEERTKDEKMLCELEQAL